MLTSPMQDYFDERNCVDTARTLASVSASCAPSVFPARRATAHVTPSDIVHIGYHKTASTWFQKRFYPCVRSHRYVERRRIQEAFLHDTATKTWNACACAAKRSAPTSA